MRMWPQMVDLMFWPFGFKVMAECINNLQVDLEGSTPESKLHDVKPEYIPVKIYHTLFCPIYILDSHLHNTGGACPLKWEPHSRIAWSVPRSLTLSCR